jgi:Tfp pilus assembly protein PilN
MIFAEKTVAGIDISQERISIVLLRNGRNGPKLVKTVVAPVPDGAIRDGHIANASLLSKTLREIKVRNGIWTNLAAVSLFTRPVVMQMIEMPKQMPSNMTQFIRGEMKHCAAMPSGDIVLDYCLVGSNRRSSDKKILAVAAEMKRVTELIHIFGRAGFSVGQVEPAILSYLRAIGDKKITGRSGSNILVAVLRRDILTLCVLRNGAVDFIRSKEIRQKPASETDLCSWLGDELAEIQKFYSVEMTDGTAKWDVTVFADVPQITQDAETVLKAKVQASSLQLRTIKDAYLDTAIGSQATNDKNEQPSPVALGLAMNLLVKQGDDVRLNLMPPQIVQLNEAKKEALIAAIVVVALLLLMILAVDAPSYMVEKIRSITAAKASQVSVRDTDLVIEKNQLLDTRIQELSDRLGTVTQISTTHNDANWVSLLENIRKATPATVRITNLSSDDGSKMHIEGLAVSNDAVNAFVSSLEKAPNIVSVALLETNKQEGKKGYVSYQISCKLVVKKGKADNVS